MRVELMRWWHLDDVHALERDLFATDAWSLEQFWSELAQPSRRYVVALVDGRVVGYAGTSCLPPDADIQTGRRFMAEGLQIAAGVPLMCDEPAGFRTFRLGLFGLDKLDDIDGSVAALAAALDAVTCGRSA